MLRVNCDGVLRDQQATSKDPSSYYGQGVVILLRVTYAHSVDQLPEVYHDIAKSPKRMERQAIEERLRSTADDLGLLNYVPAATAGCTKKISGCDFSHVDLLDLEAGIHPFYTPYRSPQACTKLRNALAAYDDLRDGTSANMRDFQVLQESECIGFPCSMMETTHCFKSFRVLLHTLLGKLHSLTCSWDAFASLWVGREARLAKYINPCNYVLIRCWLQIRFSAWFTDQHREPVQIAVPDFNGLITKILYKLYEESWQPSLPAQYSAPCPFPQAPCPRTPTPTHVRFPSPPTRPTPPACAPAAACAPAPAQPPQIAPVIGQGNHITNNHFQAAFTPFWQLGLSLTVIRDKARKANRPVPINDDHTEFCLSFHVLSSCW
jgi:hypothetical protein